MQRALDCIEGAALLAAVVLCVSIACAAWRIGVLARTADRELPALASGIQVDAQSAASSLAAAAASVQSATAEVRGATEQMQAEMPPIARQLNLDLEETHRLILESALTASEARQASVEERAALPAMTAKANASLDELTNELGALHQTTLDADRLIDDPANLQTMESLSNATGALAVTAQDGELWFHGLLHPTWPRRVYHVGLDVAHALLDPF